MQQLHTIKKMLPPPPPEVKELFDAVELNDEEINSAIFDAKRNKYFVLDEERKQQEKKDIRDEALRPWSTNELFHFAKKEAEVLVKISGKVHCLDEYVEPVFNQLCLYFSNNALFESNGLSLNKGIMLIGNVGVGKTDLLKAFRKNKRQCFLPVTCNEVEEKCRDKGLRYSETFAGPVPGHGNTPQYFFQHQVGWMFDDLGTEGIIKEYGNQLEVMEKIIHMRYMLKEHVPFNTMHLTTNIPVDDLEKRYGYRMRSRVREMFNVITLPGPDRRK